MSIVAAGKVNQLALLLAFSAAIAFVIYSALKGKMPKIRRLSAVDTIDQCIGRAVEMGRPILYSSVGYLTTIDAPQTIASFTVLEYVARKAAKMNADLRVVPRYAVLIPSMTDIVKSAYIAEGHPEMFKSEKIMFFSDTQFAYATGMMGEIARERPASVIVLGAQSGEALCTLESAVIHGAMSVFGTANTHQLPWVALTATDSLIGEELFAVGAYISKEPISVGTIGGGDIARFICIAIIGVGALLATAGVRWFADLFKI